MKTHNSYHYFRGKEAHGRGESRDSCARLRGLNRVSWQQGWDDNAEAVAQANLAKRPPEVAAENEEAKAWFERELAAWRAEATPL